MEEEARNAWKSNDIALFRRAPTERWGGGECGAGMRHAGGGGATEGRGKLGQIRVVTRELICTYVRVCVCVYVQVCVNATITWSLARFFFPSFRRLRPTFGGRIKKKHKQKTSGRVW